MACYTDWLIAKRKRIANVEFRGRPNDYSGVRNYRKKKGNGRHNEMSPTGEICWQGISTRRTITSNRRQVITLEAACVHISAYKREAGPSGSASYELNCGNFLFENKCKENVEKIFGFLRSTCDLLAQQSNGT